ncbi:MAG TPA: flavoprotein [Planctomycetota bacterium]|nr:flavoprotein [Planctomycetota bacterium]
MHVLLGVSASVAIHRSLDVVSELRKRGHGITVLMTSNATKLVTPLQFAALSGGLVHHDVFAGSGNDVYDHLTPAREGDVYLFCPASADLIARLACGMGDDMVTTTALAFEGPRFVAPAMNYRMWKNPLVQRNLALLRSLGYAQIGPADGELACGDQGPGRLAPVADILAAILTPAS